VRDVSQVSNEYVAAKGSLSQLTRLPNKRRDLVGRQAQPEYAQPASVRDRGSEFRYGRSAETDRQDRIVDIEQITQRRAQTHHPEIVASVSPGSKQVPPSTTGWQDERTGPESPGLEVVTPPS